MSYDLHIIKTSDFIKLNPQGQIDLRQSHNILARLAKACIEKGIDCALLDVRDLYGDVSIKDLYMLAKAFNEMGFRQEHRVAVLHRYGGEHAEIFAGFASDRGWNIRAFENYEEAIEWFSTALPLDPSSGNKS